MPVIARAAVLAVVLSGCGNHFCVDCSEPGEPLPELGATSVVRFEATDRETGAELRAGCFALREGMNGRTESRPVLLPVELGRTFVFDWYEDPVDPAQTVGETDETLCAEPFAPEIDWSYLRPECLAADSGELESVAFIDPSGRAGTPQPRSVPGGIRFVARADEPGTFDLLYYLSGCQDTATWFGLDLWSIAGEER